MKQLYWKDKSKFWDYAETRRNEYLPSEVFHFISIHRNGFSNTYSLIAPLKIVELHHPKLGRRCRWEQRKFKTFKQAKTTAKRLAKTYRKLGLKTVFVVNCSDES